MATIAIIRAEIEHHHILAELAAQTFIESHGHSAPQADIETYVRTKYTPAILKAELEDERNIYHLIFYNDVAAGFSRIVLHVPHPEIPLGHVTKLERLYVLKEFYDQKLGRQLFLHNEQFSRQNNDEGMWLYVWKENERAVRFYRKLGFTEAGSYDFPISPTHSNPNFRMYLKYQ